MAITINGAGLNQKGDIFNQGNLTDKKVNRQTEDRKSIFAGNQKKEQSDKANLLAQKKKYAQKQAIKLMSDAFDRNMDTTRNIEEMEREKQEAVEQLNKIKDSIREIEDGKASLKEKYGSKVDSAEQQDTELLEKYQSLKEGYVSEEFTKDEIDRLHELQDAKRTEYQNKVLASNTGYGSYNKDMIELENKIYALNDSIDHAKLSQAKSQDMLNAQDAADTIKDASKKETIGMLVQDGLEKMEKKQEEEKEKVKEAEEKKEEQEELKEKREEEKKQQEEMLSNAVEADKMKDTAVNPDTQASTVEEAQKSIQRVLTENNLLEEDLKGIEIDFNF